MKVKIVSDLEMLIWTLVMAACWFYMIYVGYATNHPVLGWGLALLFAITYQMIYEVWEQEKCVRWY